MAKEIPFQIKSFQELRVDELYEILRVRQEVFVVEQECAYLDADGLDDKAIHIYSTDKEKNIVAYARVLPPGITFPEFASIGRVLTIKKKRSQGLGRAIMEKTLMYLDKNHPGFDIKIMAQTYLLNFYQSMGFIPVGEEFLEDGIPHRYMVFSRKA